MNAHQQFKSIEDQVSLCRAFAERQGWIVLGVFNDAEGEPTPKGKRRRKVRP